MNYESLLIEADKRNLITKEKPLKAYDGRIKGNKILIRKDMKTKQKACVLAEELGHYHTTVGNILDMNVPENRKQEQRARAWAYDKMIGLAGLIKAYENRCNTLHETAEFLNVTESFLQEAIAYYQKKYGTHTKYNNYIIV
ncbi:MAG: ImmA/IrrE family metallo-endopeptidase, partial [Lachnospiraceae bacterium]|nr:ImmA/IrrE family metallo-endopeptidase [Lachnospiraceae bacterium]